MFEMVSCFGGLLMADKLTYRLWGFLFLHLSFHKSHGSTPGFYVGPGIQIQALVFVWQVLLPSEIFS